MIEVRRDMDESNMNIPIMGVSFIAGLSLSHLVLSLIGTLLVGLLSKGVDIAVRRYFQNRENFWRTEARKWKRRAQELESGE